jgi:hypothetical protein
VFDPGRICSVLVEEGVRFVLVGGLAAVLHGSPLPTVDVDLVPDRSDENLERLAAALNRLDAKLRTEAGPVEAPIDAGFLRAMPLMLNLVTDSGDLDLTFEPAGPRVGFAGWDADALDMALGSGVEIRVASLQSVVDSKRAANREKDLRALPYLESLLDEIKKDSGDLSSE